MSGRKRLRCPNRELVEKVKQQIINLIQNEGVNQFLVGEIGGFEQDSYDAVLSVKEIYPDIKIILVISKISELHEINIKRSEFTNFQKYCDDFIFPDRCADGYKKMSIIYRNNFIIENTDFIIAYNKYFGRAYKFCKQAQNNGVKVIELTLP